MSSPLLYKQLILVDDDPLVHFLIKKYLQLAGISIELISFHDGAEVLNFTKRDTENKCIILLDLSMPVYSGWDFLDGFQELSSSQKTPFDIYIMSSSIDPLDQDRIKGYKEVLGFIPKPINDKTLKKILY